MRFENKIVAGKMSQLQEIDVLFRDITQPTPKINAEDRVTFRGN